MLCYSFLDQFCKPDEPNLLACLSFLQFIYMMFQYEVTLCPSTMQSLPSPVPRVPSRVPQTPQALLADVRHLAQYAPARVSLIQLCSTAVRARRPVLVKLGLFSGCRVSPTSRISQPFETLNLAQSVSLGLKAGRLNL